MSTIVTHRAVITNVNGTDLLFQLPVDTSYNEGSFWATIVNGTTGAVTALLQPNYFAGGFFSFATPPAAGSNIFCEYDVTVDDITTFDLNGVTLLNILDIVNAIKTQNTTIAAMDKAIDNRVTTQEFTQFAETLDTKLRVLQANQPI
jgi:hypothetical protein